MGCTTGRHGAAVESPHSCHLPMMVVKIADVLQMRGTLKCYQELLKLEMLHEHQPSFFTIFVSHQWVAGAHPDPSGSQFRNLQKALRKVMDGTLRLELDMTSQFLGHHKTLTPQDRALLKDAYVWFDWFSVPQASFEQKSELRAEVQRKANLCIRSIPAYVDACQMFVALVPRMVNEKQEELNYFTWLSRGWCRAEMWCKLLSEKSDFPIIVVSAVDDVKFIMPLQWLDCPVHAGQFSYDHDRQEVCEFIKAALTFKLQRLSQRKNLNLFRYYAARYEDFLGLAAPSRTKEEFLSYFRFPSEEVALRPKGMCALACAALSSDVSLVRQLVQMKAPLNSKLPPLVEVDVLPDWTPLHLAAAHSSKSSLETMSTLLELRSDPNATNRLGHPLLGICTSAAGVDLLVKHAADVNKLSPPTMASPLVLASLRCASSEVFQKFIEIKADVNLVKGGLGLSPLHSLAINASINPHTLSVAQQLLEARADPDLPVRAGALFRSIELGARATLRLRKEPPGIIWVFGEGSTTPLGYAAMFGSQDLVDFLLDSQADPESKNHRGHTPLQLARYTSVAHIISHRTSTGSSRQLSDGSRGGSGDGQLSPWGRLETPTEYLGSATLGAYGLDDSQEVEVGHKLPPPARPDTVQSI